MSSLMEHSSNLMAAKPLDQWAQGLIGSLTNIGRAAIVVAIIFMVIYTYVTTKAFVPTLGAAILGGVVYFALSPGGLNTLRDSIGGLFAEGPAGGVSVPTPATATSTVALGAGYSGLARLDTASLG